MSKREVKNQLKAAIQLIRDGDKASGRAMLLNILKENEDNATAWLWMSAAVDTDTLRRECLEKVLSLDPGNKSAQKGLSRLQRRQSYPAPSGSAAATTAISPSLYVIRPNMVHVFFLLLSMLLFLLQQPLLKPLRWYWPLYTSPEAQRTYATVTDREVWRRKNGGRLYYVRYRFQVSGRTGWYSGASDLRDHDIRRSVTKATWDESKVSGRLEVLYMPDNPWVNVPVGLDYNPAAGSLAVWAVVTGINLITLLQVPLLALNYLRCRAAIRRGQPRHYLYWQAKRLWR